jgi:hypothetical protein
MTTNYKVDQPYESYAVVRTKFKILIINLTGLELKNINLLQN